MYKEILLGLLLGITVYAQVVGWHPPWAILVWGSPINATHFQATYEGKNAYIIQDGLTFRGTNEENFAAQQLLTQICRYIAIDTKNITMAEYEVHITGDVYCSPDGVRWAYLKWLALRIKAYSANVTLTAVNLTAITPLGNFSGLLPEGWYADLQSRYVFQVPYSNYSVVEWYYAQVEKYRLMTQSLQADLENKTAVVNRLISQLNKLKSELDAKVGQIGDLQNRLQACVTQLKNVTETKRQLEKALQQARDDLDRCTSELNVTKGQLVSCLAQVQSLSAELQTKTSEGGRFALPPYAIAAIVLIALGVGYVIYKKRAT